MLTTLGEMQDVEGREVMLKIAAEADSVDVAEFNMANALLLAAYHKTQKPVTRIFPDEPVPVALDAGNRLVVIVSADYAFWVEDLGEVITLMAEKFDSQVVADRELWLRGRASKQFEIEMRNLGWGLQQEIALTEKVREQFIQPTGETDDVERDSGS